MAAAPQLAKHWWWAFYMTISCLQTGLAGQSRAPQPPLLVVNGLKRGAKSPRTAMRGITLGGDIAIPCQRVSD